MSNLNLKIIDILFLNNGISLIEYCFFLIIDLENLSVDLSRKSKYDFLFN